MTPYDRAIAYARKRGAMDGQNAAISYLYETINRDRTWRPVPSAESDARHILCGIEDGDPAILNTFPFPDLSGQWADTLTGPELVEDALSSVGIGDDGDGREPAPERMDWFTDICDAYESAYSTAVEDEIARAAREVLESVE